MACPMYHAARSIEVGEETTIYQRCVRYGTYRGVLAMYTAVVTGSGHFAKFGATSMPVPDASARLSTTSIPVPVVPAMHVCTGAGTDFDTTSIPVPDTSVRSARYQPDSTTLGRHILELWFRAALQATNTRVPEHVPVRLAYRYSGHA